MFNPFLRELSREIAAYREKNGRFVQAVSVCRAGTVPIGRRNPHYMPAFGRRENPSNGGFVGLDNLRERLLCVPFP